MDCLRDRINMTGTEASQYPGRELEAMSFACKYHQWILDELAPYLGKTVVEVGTCSSQ